MVVGVCVAASVTRTGAQERLTSASVAGTVSDVQGGAIRGAEIRARQLETNTTARTASDEAGRFRFATLPVGPYELLVRQGGFADRTINVTLTAGAAFDFPITLAVAGVSAAVDVSGTAPILDTARSQIAATVVQDEIDRLPLNGRQFLDIALLVPGVSPTNVASTQLFAETSAIPGGGLSVASQRNFSNNYIVDGLSANDDAAGLTGMPYSIEAVDQFQVITSGAQAELGRALGGYMNVVTRSGSNVFRGVGYGYWRNDALNASNPLLGRALPMNQDQYGVSLGGPVVKDRTFFFGNLEGRNLDQQGLTTIADSSIAAINRRLSDTGYPGSTVATGLYTNPVDTAMLFAKLDHRLSGSDSVSLRYSQYNVTSSNSRGAGGLSAPTASAGLDDVDRSVSVSNTRTLGPRTVNELRAQYLRSNLLALPSDPIGPAVNIAGVAAFGTLSNSPTGRLNTLWQVADNISMQRGAHAIRIGADFVLNADRITFPRSRRGAYTFASLAAFQAGTYNNSGFTQTFGATDVTQHNPNVGLFVQDEWRVVPNLTVNAGVRYDLQFLETIRTDTNNIAPRIGVAWSPSGNRRLVVRANAGLYFDRVPLRALANALLSAGNTTDLTELRQTNVSLSPSQTGAPIFPNTLDAAVSTTTLVNFTTMDRGMQNAFSRKASLELEREFPSLGSGSIGYQYVRGENLIVSINQNVPTCVAVGNNNGCRPDPTYANNSQYSSRAASSYHGLHVSWSARPRPWASYRVTYTLSKAMTNVGEFFFSSPIDPTDLSKDWGRSDDDQRHRLAMTGGVSSPTTPATSLWELLSHGFAASAFFQYYSALPLNVTSGVTTVQGTAGRPIVNGAFIARNAGTGPDFLSANIRISRTFVMGRRKLELLAEGFNVTNRQNIVTLNGNFGSGAYPSGPSATFGRITGVGDPRSFQFGARIEF